MYSCIVRGSILWTKLQQSDSQVVVGDSAAFAKLLDWGMHDNTGRGVRDCV